MSTSLSYEFIEGTKPILVSLPHNGTVIPEIMLPRMTESAKRLVDTDWFLDQLYGFARDQGCYMICPKYSRYVIDLNRPQNDESLYPGQDTTELCPTSQFDREPIYINAQVPDQSEITQRINDYWIPYHSRLQLVLNELKQKFDGALLFEAHSIKSQVPRFFEGQLPDFNFGNFNNTTCSQELTDLVDSWNPNGYSKVLNARFKGGYITRAYGNPENNIHSIQLELSQATYMNESKLCLEQQKCEEVEPELKGMFELFYQFIEQVTNYRR
jgi:N-formylglutamate deformylase